LEVQADMVRIQGLPLILPLINFSYNAFC